METIEKNQFFKNLSTQQMSEFVTEIQHQMIYDVIPMVCPGEEEIEYIHFMTLRQENGSLKYISALTHYKNLGVNMKRDIKSIRVYTDEIEWDLYMALHEYQNQDNPNPVLFN